MTNKKKQKNKTNMLFMVLWYLSYYHFINKIFFFFFFFFLQQWHKIFFFCNNGWSAKLYPKNFSRLSFLLLCVLLPLPGGSPYLENKNNLQKLYILLLPCLHYKYDCFLHFLVLPIRKNPNNLETRKNCCNHPKIWTTWLCHPIMCPNGWNGRVDPDQTAPESRPWSDCSRE